MHLNYCAHHEIHLIRNIHHIIMLKTQSIYYALEDRYKEILEIFDQNLYFNVIVYVVAFDL